jgi:hypothetical protein
VAGEKGVMSGGSIIYGNEEKGGKENIVPHLVRSGRVDF